MFSNYPAKHPELRNSIVPLSSKMEVDVKIFLPFRETELIFFYNFS